MLIIYYFYLLKMLVFFEFRLFCCNGWSKFHCTKENKRGWLTLDDDRKEEEKKKSGSGLVVLPPSGAESERVR